MVEKGDLECAHLGENIEVKSKCCNVICFSVLVSLSYSLDFLIAVNFLGCDKLKSSYTKDIMVLENTTKTALEHIMKDLVKLYNDIELDKDGEDPYILDYRGMSPNMIKLLFKS